MKTEKCAHDPYWTGIYGSCMACKAAERDELKKIKAELLAALKIALKHIGGKNIMGEECEPELAAKLRAAIAKAETGRAKP